MNSPGEADDAPSQHTFSASPPAPGSSASGLSSAGIHKRTYQACLPCRRRKVRCDLGSVDEPGDPPCQRCRREKKECVFSETRRKRKAEEEGGDLTDDYIARNKRIAGAFGPDGGIGSMADVPAERMLPGIQHAPLPQGQPDGLPRPVPPMPKKPDKAASNRDVTNETAAVLFQGPIIQPVDALHMLVDAASRSEIQERKGSQSAADRDKLLARQEHRLSSTGKRPDLNASAIDPAIMAMQDVQRTAAQAHVAAALAAWSRLRFVQAGWFTAREAISYIDYFYEHLEPLTPIKPPDFSNYAEHPKLLEEEPMLTVTILAITSRYKRLEGPGGSTRSFKIHDKLWEYLQGMVNRMFWGQEQFGGGFCGAGSSRSPQSIEVKRRGLRTLGTAESLLLLSDWLPRAMHFPPGDDGNELLVPITDGMVAEDTDIAPSLSNIHAAWTEPALRSDRMSWSLIGMAYTLSWEIGVFDSLLDHKTWVPGSGKTAETGYTAEDERADRIGRMLLVYVSQSCGRLGFPNMMPSQGKETNFDFLKMDIPEGSHPNPAGGIISETDRIQRAWAELTALMRQSNTEMFESKRKVHQVIQDGSYIKFLEDWQPRMSEWKKKFEQTEMPAKAKVILRMEFEYTKTYINSMSLQAVVESCAAPVEEQNGPNASTSHTPPALFSSKVVDVHKQNRVYIEELIESSRNVLRLAIEGLQPSGALRHSPVRTHFRMLSGAMFLLKSFAVGGKESEVSISLNLLEQAIKALRASVIDDVHLSLRIADLLDGITTRIRRKFVRLAIPSKGSKQRSGQTQRPSTSNPTSAPKGTIHDRRAATNANGRGHHHSTSQTSNNGQNGTTTPPPGSYGQSQDAFYSSLGLDDPPPLVNLKDHNITIMPPPDLNFATSDFANANAPNVGGPVSPHSSTAVSGALASPTLGMSRPRNSSFDGPGPLPFSPAQNSFSPLSTGSGGNSAGGYDWLALDFNPLLSNNVHFGAGESSHGVHDSHPSQAHNHVGNSMQDGSGGNGHGAEDDGQTGVGASPWTMGAFGPEISEGLEMLGALGALVWEDGQGQGQPGGNPGGGAQQAW